MKELDFLPSSYREAVRRKEERRRNLLMCMGLAAAMIALHTLYGTRIRSAQAALVTLRNGANAWHSAEARLAALQKEKTRYQAHLDLISRLEDAAPLNAAVGEIAGLLSESMAIQELRVESQTSEPAGTGRTTPATEGAGSTSGKSGQSGAPAPARTHVHMTGVAANDVEIGIFLGKLGTSPLFSEVTLGFSREDRVAGRKMREFEVSCVIRPVENLP